MTAGEHGMSRAFARSRMRGGLAGRCAAAGVALVLAACNAGDAGDPVWRQKLLADRANKDLLFHTPRGPLAPEQRPSFQGLKYYAPDPEWNVQAIFAPAAVADSVRFATSTGSVDVYVRAGRASFRHAGRDLALTVYQNPQTGSYFLPFTDATSAAATYGAGRYVDPEIPAPGPFTLDFNRAYNPYCAYNSGWVCPLAPPENHLDVAVEAGEKKFNDDH